MRWRRLWLALLATLVLGSVAPGRADDGTAPARTTPRHADPASALELPALSPSPIAAAWREPAANLAERVERTRAAALTVGMRETESAARALLAEAGPAASVAEAQAAVRLASGLPAAHVAEARAHARARAPLRAVTAAYEALRRLDRHLDPSLGLRAGALALLAAMLTGGGLLFVGLAGIASLPQAAHDLGDRLSREMAGFARAGLIALLLLAPLLLGEGLLGLALVLFAIAYAAGDGRRRMVLAVAAALLLAGSFPVSRVLGRHLAALSADPVTWAAAAVERGDAGPLELAQLERAAGDPLADAALALTAWRSGALADAEARYRELRGRWPHDPVLANNAANVRLARGDAAGAIELYRAAVGRRPAAEIYYNLSQAYGQAIRPDEQGVALERAQRLDLDLVDELTDLGSLLPASFVVDLPTPPAELRARLLTAAGRASDPARLIPYWAPGRLGADARVCGAAFVAAALLASLSVVRWPSSRWCGRCGRRVCPRCDADSGSPELCPACARLFTRPEATDPALRTARLAQLRRRQLRRDRASLALALLVPGAAGLLVQRPLLALSATLSIAGLAACASVPWLALPVPAAAGAAAPLAWGIVLAAFGVGYAGTLALGVLLERDA